MAAQGGRAVRHAERDRVARDLETLAGLHDDGLGGWTRLVFSQVYADERQHVLRLMREAGLSAAIDPAGNVIGRLEGTNPSLRPILTGSHTDTVRNGGRFDGVVGVVGAIETVRLLRASGIVLEHDLIVADFLGEEANPWGVSCIGSRSISGRLTAEHLELRPADGGPSLGEAMAGFGLDPAAALGQAWRRDALHAYIELHIEQGPMLERSGSAIGVVTAIAGIDRLLARFEGRPDHAGTAAMGDRRDALAAAAEAVLTIEREGCGAPVHGVSTTGMIDAQPGSFNVVPGSARIWAELRSVDERWLGEARRRLAREIAAGANARGVEVDVEWLNDQPPVQASRSLQDHIARSAGRLDLGWEPVPSGAGHDAAHMDVLGPMGMVFVPSAGGRSHVPEEHTDLGDILHGIDVLAETIVSLDRASALVR